MDSKAALSSILNSASPRLVWPDSRFFFVHYLYITHPWPGFAHCSLSFHFSLFLINYTKKDKTVRLTVFQCIDYCTKFKFKFTDNNNNNNFQLVLTFS